MVLTIGPRNPVSQQLHAAKYRQRGESFDDYCVRYARTTADDEQHFRLLLEGLRTQAILPAGRQQRAVGWPFLTTAFNCFVSAAIPDDTRGIGDALTEAMLTLRSGGGCGWDFSTLRPRGEPVRGLGDDAYASGPVSFMGMWHAMCDTIRSAGERRGAMMGVLRVDHPDILTFIRAKENEKSLTNFNISVGVTDDFMSAVENDKLFPLSWGGRRFKDVRALDLWAVIMENNWDWAEPGVLFLDVINRMNPLYYCETITATNPCVPGDTLILTDRGHLPIRDLVGERVNIWNGRHWSEVIPRQTGNDQPLVEVRLDDGSNLVCTPSHKFVLDGRADHREEAGNLLPGMKLRLCEFPVVNSGTNVGSAYTQGLFTTDGWFDKRGRAYISLYGEKLALVDEITDRESVAEYDVTKTRFSPQAKGTCIHVRLDPAKLADDKFFVPDCSWSVQSRLDWLAGVVDGDGYVTKEGGLQISSKVRPFLEKVRLMLQTLGVPSRINVSERRPGYHHLLVSGWYVTQLVGQGFVARRLDLSHRTSRNCRASVKVVEVLPLIYKEDVFCFNEERLHRGVFNGVLTGQCSEQPLPPNGACLLLSHNMVKYLVPSYARGDGKRRYEIDFDRFRRDIATSVRACDNVFEKTVYPLDAQRQEAFAKRRMGIGITGMANVGEICGFRYGTSEYIDLQTRVLTVLRDVAYRTSVELARIKGSFPLFDADKWLSSGFAQTLPDDIRWAIKRYGLRNGLLLSIAPTGTISLTADNVSSGIEPPPMLECDRTINFAEGPRTVPLNDYAFEEYGVRGRTALETSPAEHVAVLCAAQKFVDSAISKTVNIRGAKTSPPAEGEVTFKEFKDVYLDSYHSGAKGCSTFNVNGKRAGIIQERKAESAANGKAELCEVDPTTGARICG